MTKFKAGDKFIIRKPENLWKYNSHWVERMERYWNRTMTIDEIQLLPDDKINLISDDKINLISECASFNAALCEKVEGHIPKASKVIDWEQRRYEIAKDFMAAQINSLYSKNKCWSYEEEAQSSINAADELIKQLQKSPEN